MDERITVPQGAAPPLVIKPLENIPTDLVESDIFMTGEVNLLNKEPSPEQNKAELIKSITSFAAHILFIALIILEPKIFPPHQRTREEDELARRQMTILLPPGALDEPKATPRPRPPAVHVDPRILRKVAPPVPQPIPTPPAKEPERVAKELPSAPVPQPNTPQPKPDDSSAKADAPKQPLKLETPQQQPTDHSLLLPKSSLGHSLQDSIRESAKMNAPSAVGGGGPVPSNSGLPGGRRASLGVRRDGNAHAHRRRGFQRLSPPGLHHREAKLVFRDAGIRTAWGQRRRIVAI